MTVKTRIAVAGAGYIGQAHMQALLASPDCTLSAVVDPSPAAAQQAQQLGVPCFASLEEMLQQARPDGVVLATPNQLHVAHASLCMRAGLPMLLEKPVAPTVAEGRQLLALQAETGTPILVGHHRAHSPIMAQAREVIRSGQLGQLVAVTGSALFVKPDHYYEDAPWRKAKGAGPILLNMIHEVHNLRMLCGEIRAVQAFASHRTRGFEVEDSVAISLHFEAGAVGTFLLSDTAASARSWEQTSQENPAYPSYDDEDCYLVAGTHGSLAIPTMRVKRYLNDADRSWWKPFSASVVDMVRSDPIPRQMAHFGQVIRGEVAPLVSLQDGVNNLVVTEAIVQAAASGRTVEIS